MPVTRSGSRPLTRASTRTGASATKTKAQAAAKPLDKAKAAAKPLDKAKAAAKPQDKAKAAAKPQDKAKAAAKPQHKAKAAAQPMGKPKSEAKNKRQVVAAAEAAEAREEAEEKALAADAKRLKPRNKKTSAERALELLQRIRQSPTQYWSLAGGLEIVHSSRKGTAENLRKTLRTGIKEGEHIEVLRAAAHAVTFEDGCHGDDVDHGYVLKYMVSFCTDAFVAFVNEVPVGFALLDQSAPTEIDLGMICASEKARGAGKALLQKAIDFAQHEEKTLTLSSLPTVVSYYAKHGFQLGKTCGDHADLEHKHLADTRVVKKGRNYDYSQVAPLFEELHRKKMAVNQEGICGDPKATFAQLQDEGCHMDGYYMHLCPQTGRKAARALSPASGVSPGRDAASAAKAARAASPVPSARASPVQSPVPSARASPVPSPVPSARASPVPSPRASPAPRAPPTSPVVRAAKGAKGAKQRRAARADHVPRPRDGLRRVTQEALLESNDPKDVWRRKTKEGWVQLMSRRELEAYLKIREDARTSKRVQRDDDRRARSAERKAARKREASERKASRRQEAVERKQAKGKCASAKQVREKGGDLRVCSGNPKYGNAKRLNQAQLVKVEKEKGKRAAKKAADCATARHVRGPEGNGFYVCSGDARYGNYRHINKEDLDELERVWGRRCAPKKDVIVDTTGDLRYCPRRGDVRYRLDRDDVEKGR